MQIKEKFVVLTVFIFEILTTVKKPLKIETIVICFYFCSRFHFLQTMIEANKTLERGKFLISEPFLQDSFFKRAVVLLCEHTETGTIGFILNKPTELRFNEVMQECPIFDAPVYFGGPVEQSSLHYIHRLGNQLEGSKEIIKGVYWGGNFEQLKSMMNNNQITPADVRFFIGYSGWQDKQLENEMKEKSWIISSADEQFTFFDNPKELWRGVLKSLGKDFAILANFPEDPSLN